MEMSTYYPAITMEGKEIVNLETWHRIDGKWVHIYQDYRDVPIKCYTDGVLEDVGKK